MRRQWTIGTGSPRSVVSVGVSEWNNELRGGWALGCPRLLCCPPAGLTWWESEIETDSPRLRLPGCPPAPRNDWTRANYPA